MTKHEMQQKAKEEKQNDSNMTQMHTKVTKRTKSITLGHTKEIKSQDLEKLFFNFLVPVIGSSFLFDTSETQTCFS